MARNEFGDVIDNGSEDLYRNERVYEANKASRRGRKSA
jgi:hypothetical protein